MLVDSHCHLDFPDFAAERDAVIARARAAGVGTMLTIGTRLDQFPAVRAIAEAYDDVWCSVGAHPHEAADHAATDGRAVGRACRASAGHRHRRDRARFPLRSQPARRSGAGVPRPYRGLAGERTAADHACPRGRRRDRAHSAARNSPPAGVLHCFSSGRALAEAALDLGFYISISGIVTFRNADELRAIVRDVPLDRLLVETDAPYLAPVPYRGKRNEPAYVAATAAAVADAEGGRRPSSWPRRRPRISSACSRRRAARPQARRDMRVTVLGCGASWGVPAIGPDWGRCDPADPRNRRRRCSLLVESRGAVLLIDTSPDLREQLLDAGVARLDAVLLTHAHADHLHGIDDLRMVNRLIGQAIPVLCRAPRLWPRSSAASAMPCCRRPDKPLYRPALIGAADRRPVHRRRHSGRAVCAGSRLFSMTPGLSHRAGRLFDRCHRTRRDRVCRARRGRALDRRLPAPRAASDA